jgi:hypothetical protein
VRDGRIVKVVIPALNEQASLPAVLGDIPTWVDETVVVDNASTDATAPTARRHGARVVAEPRRGYGRACRAGLDALGPVDVIVFLDADGSDDPSRMAWLVDPILAGRAEMVLGSRVSLAQPGSVTAAQRWGNRLACGLMRLIWRTRYTDLGPFRAIDRAALARLQMRDPTYGWTIEMQIKAARAQLRVEEVAVPYRPRVGTSKISGTLRGVVGASWKILSTIALQACCPSTLVGSGDRQLIVFTRYPLPGLAKTRMIPQLGAVGSADLQRSLTERTLAGVCPAPGDGYELCVHYAGGTGRAVRRWLGGGLPVAPQRGGDLGRRMYRSLSGALARGARRAVLIGTDCPAVTREHIRSAFERLAGADVVLGPSTDGGYWLVGMRRPVDIFRNVEWSTPRALEQTEANARRAHLTIARLPVLSDLDTPDDLPPGSPQARRRPWVSVIVPAINEAGTLASAVRSARVDGAEVIVVDGGSDDDTVEVARQAGADRIETCAPGRWRQMNVGSAAAKGKVLLFCHADTQLPAGWLAHVFHALADRRVVGGAFAHTTDHASPAMRIIDALVALRTRCLQMPYGDQAIFVRREDFEAVGGYRAVALAEDLDLVADLRRRGRLAALPVPAVTSGRRWRDLGVLRTTLTNQLMLAGILLGVDRERLARVYRGR